MSAAVRNDFGPALARLRRSKGVSLRALAEKVNYSKTYLSDIERGLRPATEDLAARSDSALGARGALAALLLPDDATRDLADRVAATDVSEASLRRLEDVVEQLAVDYSSTSGHLLLPVAQRHVGYVAKLLDGRMTLTQHRRLLNLGAWLSLEAATIEVDLHERTSAHTRLRLADGMAKETEHAELRAWVMETRAWDQLTEHDYRAALTLSQAAQHLAPAGSSALIQATAQEGRALARLGQPDEVRAVIGKVTALAGPLPTPDRPEHHYRYDPSKLDAYVATTLSWSGDAAAEAQARQVLARLEAEGRHRRASSARIDLGLALAESSPDEAAAVTLDAVRSGLIVPSNLWRVGEVVTAIGGRPETAELTAAYRDVVGRIV